MRLLSHLALALAASTALATDAAAQFVCVSPETPIVREWTIGTPVPNPELLTISVCDEPEGAAGFSVEWVASCPAQWLTVSPGFGEFFPPETQAVTLSFHPQTLGVGQHATSVIFQNFNDPNDFQVVSVQLTINAPPANLSITADEAFEAEYVIGGGALPLESFLVANVGPSGSTLAWAAATNPPVSWLTFAPDSGSVASVNDKGTPTPVNVHYIAAGLAPGVYETDLVVSNLDVAGDSETIPVKLTVSEPTPELCLPDVSAIKATYEIAGPVPAAVTRTARNCGHGLSWLPLKVSTMPTAEWITLTPMSAFLPGPDGEGTGNEVGIEIGFAPEGLAPGLYQTAVRFENVAEPENFFDVQVTLTVTMPGADLEVDDASAIDVTYIIGGDIPDNVIRNVSNVGPAGSILEWTFSETPDMPWLFHTPTGGVLESGASEAAVVQFAVAGLAEGVYTGAVRMQNDADSKDFVEIPVSLEVIDPKPDLCLDAKQTDITATWQIGQPAPADVVFDLGNCGHELSTLSFGIAPSAPAAWLTVAPMSGQIAGVGELPIALSFAPAGLVDGVYETTLRLQNLEDPLDFEELVVRLMVGNIVFVPGDRIQGGLHEFDAAYELEFDAVQGMKMPIKMKSAEGEPPGAAQITVVDAEGAVVQSEKLVYSQGKSAKAVLKMKNSGRHKLRVEPFKNRFGNFILNTKRQLPKKASEHELTKSAGDDLMAPVKVLALEGATIDLKIQPKGGPGQLSVTAVEAPNGDVLDVTGFGQALGTGGWIVKGVPATGVGPFVFRIEGFDDPGQGATVKVMPAQPEKGTATVILPIQ